MVTMGIKIKMLLARRNMTQADLSRLLGISTTNLNNKFKRDNFSEKELIQIAEKLDAQFIGTFELVDTKEKI
jgi:transcriptional regulator with XRE-family HTH domain